MQHYYTSIEIDNGRYTGVVYNSSNNAIEYRSKSCSSQIQAMLDVTEYLKSKQSQNKTNNSTPIRQPQIITNSTTYHPAPQAPKRCCGR